MTILTSAIALVVALAGCGRDVKPALPTAPRPVGAAPGANSDLTWGDSHAEIDRTVSVMKQAGVRWVRLAVSWSAGEPNQKGSYDEAYLGEVDYVVDRVRAAGIEALMLIDGVPRWASANPSSYDTYWRPRSFNDYADFTGYMVNRYKGKGVHRWEVWNEPDLQRFWKSGVNATEYTEMLKAAATSIRAADPSARVLLAGLSPHGAYDFLERVYSAGGRPYFDIAAYHVYPKGDPDLCRNGLDGKPASDSFCTLDEFRRIMSAHGDRAKKVWITEYGYSTCAGGGGTPCFGLGVNEAQQADYLVEMQRKFDSPAYAYVTAAFLYQLRDFTADNAISSDNWEENLGLLRRDFSAKPAFGAFKGYNLTKRSSGATAVDG